MASYLLGLVGERNYQAAVAALKVGQAVAIEGEPDNPFDPRAVRASVGGRTIGYAPRDGWIARALHDEGREIGATVHAINGGGDRELGVVLKIVLDGEDTPLRGDEQAAVPAAGGVMQRAGEAALRAAQQKAAAQGPGKSNGSNGVKPAPTHPPAWIYAVGVVAAVVLFGVIGSNNDKPASPAAPTAQPLSDEAVAKCRAVTVQAEKLGLIRKRPAPNRINVDERLWNELDAETKDRTLQAVACELWRQAMPPSGEHVVAYGWRSGKRIQMLTEVGMSRE